jgi:hypothetical protein
MLENCSACGREFEEGTEYTSSWYHGAHTFVLCEHCIQQLLNDYIQNAIDNIKEAKRSLKK